MSALGVAMRPICPRFLITYLTSRPFLIRDFTVMLAQAVIMKYVRGGRYSQGGNSGHDESDTDPVAAISRAKWIKERKRHAEKPELD
jgi:hypothetical protein